MRVLPLFFLTLIALLPTLAQASPGTEIALVLDNSCSMAFPATDQNGNTYPPNDPERAAVLGALVVEGLVRGSNDRLSVFAFPDQRGGQPRVVTDAAGIRSLPYANHTLFVPPLRAARSHLDSSRRDDKLLLFFSDGVPEDLQSGQTAASVFGMDTAGSIDTFVLGLYGSTDVRDMAQGHVDGLARRPDDNVFMDDPGEVVPAFTRAYARTLGSKPQTGTLQPGGSLDFDVGKYVTEVLVFVASEEQGPAFEATLRGPTGALPVQASGDDGCEPALAQILPPNLCGNPRRHYQVFRAPSDPLTASTWSLSVNNAASVRYGIILRYDLRASLAIDPTVRIGNSLPVEAELLFRGSIFDDEDFFTSDGFTVSATIGKDTVPLTHAGGGRFSGTWTPTAPTDGAVLATVHFSNTWMEQSDSKQTTAEGFLPLTLRPTPSPVRLGNWRGWRTRTERCATVSLAGSENADVVPVSCLAEPVMEGQITCSPLPAQGTAQPLEWEVCLVAEPCCGDIPGDGDSLAVTFRGTHDHYASGAVRVPIEAKVDATGFLRCWWLPISIALGVLTFLWFVYGWLRPNSFDPGMSVKIAGDEKGLRRTVALVLAEQPGGRRGFYRNARVAFDGNGDALRKTRRAILVVSATGGGMAGFTKAGGLERKDRRTRKWTALTDEELREGVLPGVVYRVGSLYLKFS